MRRLAVQSSSRVPSSTLVSFSRSFPPSCPPSVSPSLWSVLESRGVVDGDSLRKGELGLSLFSCSAFWFVSVFVQSLIPRDDFENTWCMQRYWADSVCMLLRPSTEFKVEFSHFFMKVDSRIFRELTSGKCFCMTKEHISRGTRRSACRIPINIVKSHMFNTLNMLCCHGVLVFQKFDST